MNNGQICPEISEEDSCKKGCVCAEGFVRLDGSDSPCLPFDFCEDAESEVCHVDFIYKDVEKAFLHIGFSA